MRLYVQASVFFVAFALACGNTQVSADAATDIGSGDGGPQGTVAIAVASAYYVTTIGSTPPSTGDHFLVVNATVTNQSVVAPVAVDPQDFSVVRGDGSVVGASDATSGLAIPCSANLAVVLQASYTCQVAFELGLNDAVGSLSFADSAGHVAQGTIGASHCALDPTAASNACVCCAEQRCATPGDAGAGTQAPGCSTVSPTGTAIDVWMQAYASGECATELACARTCANSDCGCTQQCFEGSLCALRLRDFDTCVQTACASECQ